MNKQRDYQKIGSDSDFIMLTSQHDPLILRVKSDVNIWPAEDLEKKKPLAYRFGRQTWEAYLRCTSTHCIKQLYQGYNNQPVPQLEEPFSDQQTHQHRNR